MRSLPRLTELFLHARREETFSWGDKVPNLRVLHVTSSRVGANALLPLLQLQELQLNYCIIPSLEALAPIAPQLKELSMDSVSIEALTSQQDKAAFFSSLTKTERAHVTGSEFQVSADLSPLSRLVSLSTLVLGNELVTDLSPLSGLAQLEVLDFAAPHDIDWSPITRLRKLEVLKLDGDFSDWSGSWAGAIQALPALRYLALPFKLSRKYPLQHLKSLDASNSSGEVVKFGVGCCPRL